MPVLNVKISGQPNPEGSEKVAALLVELAVTILGKQRDVTAVALDYVPDDQWFVGGSLLSEQRKKSFYFDIKIVEGTNTKDEMGQFVREAFHGLEKIFGDVHPESYIYVEEVRGFSYGYGGVTQEHRYIEKKLNR